MLCLLVKAPQALVKKDAWIPDIPGLLGSRLKAARAAVAAWWKTHGSSRSMGGKSPFPASPFVAKYQRWLPLERARV